MAETPISKILACEEKAKLIIDRTTEKAKKSHSDAIMREKEALKQEENRYRELISSHLAQLEKEAEAKLNNVRLNKTEVEKQTRQALEKHKSRMTAMVTDYITGMEGM